MPDKENVKQDTKKRGVARSFFFGWLFPVDAIRKGAKAGAGTSSVGKMRPRFGVWWREYQNAFARAVHAVKEPEVFESIEALEKNWGVNDQTRPVQVKNLARYRLLLVVVGGLVVLAMIRLPATAASSFVFALGAMTGLGALLCLGAIVSTVSWRLYVLRQRIPITFIDYVKGKR